MTETKETAPMGHMAMACRMAKDTIENIYSGHETGEALSDIDIDKVLDSVKILSIAGGKGTGADIR